MSAYEKFGDDEVNGAIQPLSSLSRHYFLFYVILSFATVTRIVSQRRALTSMKKNRITCHDQK